MTVKNITVSVPEHVYRAARIHAAESGTSVSAIVTDYLTSIAHRDSEFERLADQQQQVVSGIEEFRAGRRLGRDELHERAIR